MIQENLLYFLKSERINPNGVLSQALMKRGARPKTLPGASSGANTTVAERLADWQQNLSDQVR